MKAAVAWNRQVAALGPLRSFVPFGGFGCSLTCSLDGRSGKGACGQSAALRWSGLRFAPTSLRCSVSRPRRRTRCVHFVHCAQTTATSQTTKRAARAAASPALLGAPEARRSLPASPFAVAALVVVVSRATTGSARRAVRLAGSLNGAEERSPVVGARSALRCLTRRRCLNAVSAANEVSSAPRPRGEHRRGVAAKRRPPLREPARRTDRRAAPSTVENIQRLRRSATGRKLSLATAQADSHCQAAIRWSH